MDYSRLSRIPLVSALRDSEARAAYADITYYERLMTVAKYLGKQVYPHVNQGMTRAEPTQWFTDHGPDHVVHVAERADELVHGLSGLDPLTAYEAYILLASVLFHDVGNIYKRDEHEKKIGLIMRRAGPDVLGPYPTEHRLIRDIASAHGGFVDQTKDTIGKLQYSWTYDRPRHSDDVRAHLLAAIVRLADELADDSTRSSRFLMAESGLVEGSEAYHLYAQSLQRVQARLADNHIHVLYQLPVQDVLRLVRKGDEHVYLFDYLEERILKLYTEFLYCTRYIVPIFGYRELIGRVEICSDTDMLEPLMAFSFQLSHSGYPAAPKRLGDICPELKGWTGKRLKEELGVQTTNE